MQVSSLQYRKLDFEEFCAAAISVHQLEGMESWEQHARRGYEFFEKDGNRPIMIEELASVHSLTLICLKLHLTLLVYPGLRAPIIFLWGALENKKDEHGSKCMRTIEARIKCYLAPGCSNYASHIKIS